jgi:hypothetical protein
MSPRVSTFIVVCTLTLLLCIQVLTSTALGVRHIDAMPGPSFFDIPRCIDDPTLIATLKTCSTNVCFGQYVHSVQMLLQAAPFRCTNCNIEFITLDAFQTMEQQQAYFRSFRQCPSLMN